MEAKLELVEVDLERARVMAEDAEVVEELRAQLRRFAEELQADRNRTDGGPGGGPSNRTQLQWALAWSRAVARARASHTDTGSSSLSIVSVMFLLALRYGQ